MKEKLKKELKNLPSLFSGALICAALMIIIYALKGVWPFGTADITFDDMAQSSLPIQYHIYDWFHGEKAMNFDWFTGLGVNIISSAIITPFHLVLLLFERENLIHALAALILVYVIAAAVTSKFVFDKLFPDTNQLWRTAFSALYAMSAYSMYYYTNSSWLAFVAVFPLVIYGLKLLLVDNKPICYTLFFAYTLFLSVYQGFMITLAVFFLSGIYLVLLAPKEIRGQRTCMLGLSTLTGALLSAWRSVPTAIQTFSSKRLQTSLETEEGLISKILNKSPISTVSSKLILTVGLQLAFILVVLLIVRYFKAKKKKEALFVFGAVTVTLSPVVFENTNLIWHGGSYIGFTMRFFYASVFTVLLLALLAIDRYGETITVPKNKIVKALTLVAAAVFTVGFVYALYFYITNCHSSAIKEGDTTGHVYSRCFALIAATAFPLFTLLLLQKKYITRAFCFVLCIVQCFATGYTGIANEHQKKAEEKFYNSSSFVEYCNEVSALDTDCGVMGKIKNADTSLNTNYPFLLASPAFSNWTHTIPLYMQQAAAALGYSTQYTRVLDSGGTAFTDGIFGIKKLVQRNHHKITDQYTLIESTENFNLYENNYPVEFGLLADEGLLESITDAPLEQRFETQNKLWQLFTGGDDELFEICTRDADSENIRLVSSSDSMLVFRYVAKEDSVLYINFGKYEKKHIYKTEVNGELVLGAYYKQTKYYLFPSAAVNGIMALGSFKAGETAEITVSCINGNVFTDDTVQLACMPLEKMTALNTFAKDNVTNEAMGKSSLSFDYSNTSGEAKYLFVPVTYDKGWSCEINGEKAAVHKALGAYIAVEVPEGKGHVSLEFTAYGTDIGIAISLAGVAILTIMLFIMKKRGYEVPQIIGKTVFAVFAAVVILAHIAVYIIPAGYSVAGYIEKIETLI